MLAFAKHPLSLAMMPTSVNAIGPATSRHRQLSSSIGGWRSWVNHSSWKRKSAWVGATTLISELVAATNTGLSLPLPRSPSSLLLTGLSVAGYPPCNPWSACSSRASAKSAAAALRCRRLPGSSFATVNDLPSTRKVIPGAALDSGSGGTVVEAGRSTAGAEKDARSSVNEDVSNDDDDIIDDDDKDNDDGDNGDDNDDDGIDDIRTSDVDVAAREDNGTRSAVPRSTQVKSKTSDQGLLLLLLEEGSTAFASLLIVEASALTLAPDAGSFSGVTGSPLFDLLLLLLLLVKLLIAWLLFSFFIAAESLSCC